MCDTYTDIYEKLSKLQWLLHRQQMFNQAEHGPFADRSRGQGRVLAMLKLQPEISTKDLAYLLGIRQQSLNELLNKLEKSGYIVRKPSETDKRVMIIHLTEKGEETQQPENDYYEIFSCLNEEELNTFGEYLDRVIAALEEQVGDRHDDDMEDWMQEARSRMGDERFEKLMSMRGKGFGKGFGHFGHGRGPKEMYDNRGFSHGYDGPAHERGDEAPFDWHMGKKDKE